MVRLGAPGSVGFDYRYISLAASCIFDIVITRFIVYKSTLGVAWGRYDEVTSGKPGGRCLSLWFRRLITRYIKGLVA